MLEQPTPPTPDDRLLPAPDPPESDDDGEEYADEGHPALVRLAEAVSVVLEDQKIIDAIKKWVEQQADSIPKRLQPSSALGRLSLRWRGVRWYCRAGFTGHHQA